MRKGLARSRYGLAAALDVGCSKTCCFIARLEDGAPPHVIGIGQQASHGMKGGAVVDLAALEATILNAVHAAEQMAGQTVDRVIVSLSGGHPASYSVGVEVAINGHEIGEADLRRAFAQGENGTAQNVWAEGGRELVHSIPVGYHIDGHRGVRDPRGLFGEQLGIDIHVVTAAASALRNLTTCVQRNHLDVAAFVVAPYASGLAALVDDEKELGVTVIDMGGGTTSIAVFAEGNAVYTDVIAVGGMHVTNDIARGLSTPLAHAERMKTLFGHAMPAGADERELIDVPQVGEDEQSQMRQVPRSLLVGIIQPRLEETFELVRSHLEASGFAKFAGRRVVLTGGACQLSGLPELAALILDKQVRIGRPIHVRGLAEATAGPAYATAAGLLDYANMVDEVAAIQARPQDGEPEGLIGRFGNWVREYF